MPDASWIALVVTAGGATAYLVGIERRAGFSAAEIVKVHGVMAIAICPGAALSGLVERGVVTAFAAPPGLHLARQARHPGFLLGALAATRASCWLAGCCFGGITDLPWGVTFPHGFGIAGLLGMAWCSSRRRPIT